MSPAGTKVRENRIELLTRVRVLAVLLMLGLVTVVGGFWFVQIVQGELYTSLAENNRLRKRPVDALRGLIFDRTGQVLAENMASYNLLIDRSATEDLEASLAYAGELLGRTSESLANTLERYRGVPTFTPVLLAENLSLAQVARFGVWASEHPEFEIDVRHLRLYRYGPQTAHTLGYLGEVSQEELDLDPEAYQIGELVGRRGVERTYDRDLRGRGGEQVVVVDSRGQVVEEFRNAPALGGEDLTLTLDLELQQEAQVLLRDQVGAIVALDPRDGAVLALASSPTYNPNQFSRRLPREQWQAMLDAPHNPLQNRAIQSAYPPGSVFKIVMGVAGLSEGVVRPEDRVFCGGAATIYNHRFRCWRRQGHGWVNLHQAIQHSCDVYFYHLGQKLGIQRIADYSRRFGLGTTTGIDLASEKPGLVPDLEWSTRVRRLQWYPGETISVSIGQGALLTTPLQVARMMAIAANGGLLVTPRLVREHAEPPKRQNLSSHALEIVRRALVAVVNDVSGTGRNSRVEGLLVAGKTGTAQVIHQQTWTDSDTLPFEHRDHAWFASFAPADDPQLVIVVFLEHGGKGSGAAAPLARQLYEKFFARRVGNRLDF